MWRAGVSPADAVAVATQRFFMGGAALQRCFSIAVLTAALATEVLHREVLLPTPS